jgi:hypothetical protein
VVVQPNIGKAKLHIVKHTRTYLRFIRYDMEKCGLGIPLTLDTRLQRQGNKVFMQVLSPLLYVSHSRRRRMLLKINDLSHGAFVNIKSIESTAYAFYAASNVASFELTC